MSGLNSSPNRFWVEQVVAREGLREPALFKIWDSKLGRFKLGMYSSESSAERICKELNLREKL